MTKKLLAGNWKMHGDLASVRKYLSVLRQNQALLNDSLAELCIMPPYAYLGAMQELSHLRVHIGAQNLAAYEKGAYTGEVSASMLKDMHCQYVLVGHSERRQYFHEQGDVLKRKYQLCLDHDMIPVLCIGETLEQREQGQTFDVLRRQLLEVLDGTSAEALRIAYEPVWAIGTGVSAKKSDVEEAHGFIKQTVWEKINPNVSVKVLYGGSVTEHNAAELLNALNVDGGLVGGASLDAARFLEIAKCINSFY